MMHRKSEISLGTKKRKIIRKMLNFKVLSFSIIFLFFSTYTYSQSISSYIFNNKNASEIQKAIDNGADVNARNSDSTTALMWAARNNNLEIAELLIKNGADVNARTKMGSTALEWAEEKGHKEMVDLLKKYGGVGYFPVPEEAIKNNRVLEVKEAIEKGANINYETSWTALMMAAKYNSLEIAKLLIEKGADVNLTNQISKTPLMIAAEHNSLEVAKLLIEKGANINAADNGGVTPLGYAAKINSLNVAELLVEKGAEVNPLYKKAPIKPMSYRTPLMYAAIYNSIDVAKLLIERGANINEESKYGSTALIEAVSSNSYDVAKLLIENKANVNAKDRHFGKTPLTIAEGRNNQKMLSLLKHSGAKFNPLVSLEGIWRKHSVSNIIIILLIFLFITRAKNNLRFTLILGGVVMLICGMLLLIDSLSGWAKYDSKRIFITGQLYLGIIYTLFSIAILARKNWARIFMIWFSALVILFLFIFSLLTLLNDYSGLVTIIVIWYISPLIVFNAFFIFFLTRLNVKEQFKNK